MAEKAAPKKRTRSYHNSPWTKAEREKLEPHLATFRKADKEGRRQLLGKTVIPDLYDLHPNLDERDKAELKRKVKAWFSNNGRRKDKDRAFKLLPTRISLGTVIAHEEKVAIEAEVRRLSRAAPGSKEYLRYYRQGLKTVKEGLPVEKLQQYQDAAVTWQERGYPPAIQRRNADKKGAALARSMDELRFHNCGQRAITFAFHVGEEGKLGVQLFDFNNKFGDKSVNLFEDMFPNELKDFYGVIWKYAKYAHKIDASAPPESFRVKRTQRCFFHPGLGRKAGYPVFNPVAKGELLKLSESKILVRAFLNQHYALAVGKQSASAPFKAIGQDHLLWAEAQYWPPGVQVTDPSRMNEPEIKSLLSFWTERQDQFPPSEIFRWSHVQVGGKKSPTKVRALYPNVHAVAEGDDDSTQRQAGAGSRKAAKGKKKGKGKQTEKKSQQLIPDDDECNAMLNVSGPPLNVGPDEYGRMPNVEPPVDAHNVDQILQCPSQFIPSQTHLSHPTTYDGPNEQIYQLPEIRDIEGLNDNDQYLPPTSGPNDHLYEVEGSGASRSGPSLMGELQPYGRPVDDMIQEINPFHIFEQPVATFNNAAYGSWAGATPPNAQQFVFTATELNDSPGPLPTSNNIAPLDSTFVLGYNFPAQQMVLPSHSPGGQLPKENIPQDSTMSTANTQAPPHISKNGQGNMTKERPKPRPSAGSRRVDPLDEDSFFMMNVNGKRLSPAHLGTIVPPVVLGETTLHDVPQHKRPRYEEPIPELVDGPRRRIPVTKPGFVKGPVKKGVRAKRT